MNDPELDITDRELWKDVLDMAMSEGALGLFSGPVSPLDTRDRMMAYFDRLQALEREGGT